jgi:hypothetical protein
LNPEFEISGLASWVNCRIAAAAILSQSVLALAAMRVEPKKPVFRFASVTDVNY